MNYFVRRWGRLIAGLAALCVTAPSVVLADWREEVEVLRVGVMTGDNARYHMARLEPFRIYLEERLTVPVEIIPAQNFDALIDAQSSSYLHYAIYSATAFSTAAEICKCVEPLVMPTRAGGETGFYALLIARAEGTIKSLGDAKGARLALADEDSVAGRLLQMRALEQEDIVPSEYFSRVIDTPDPEMAISTLLAGEVDLAVAWSSLAGSYADGYSFGVLATLVASEELSMDQIHIVWRSPLIPFGPHAIRQDLPDDLKTLLSNALLEMAKESPAALDAVDRFGGQGLVAVDAERYAPITALVVPSTSSH
jgi:phosphonate transport system substrate-binding protein